MLKLVSIFSPLYLSTYMGDVQLEFLPIHSLILKIVRFRSGHVPTPTHLHRIGVEIPPFCVCGGENIVDIDHIYLCCSRYKNKIEKFYANITSEKIILSTRMTILLLYLNFKSEITKIVINHILSIGWLWNNI